jgi:hypothetical protein
MEELSYKNHECQRHHVKLEERGLADRIHSLPDAAGMPLAHRTTPANGHERAQAVPLLDAVRVRTGRRGRPAPVMNTPPEPFIQG